MSLLDQEKIVLAQPHGGLGDNLLYSSLPERFAALGKEVYISSQNVMRSPNAYDLVWGRNPYVAGVIDAPPNAGDCCYARYNGSPKILNIISRIEAAHDLPPQGLIPKLYYQPNILPELADQVVIDITSVTVGFTGDNVSWYLTQMFQWYRLDRAKALQVKLEPGAVTRNVVHINEIGSIELRDIYHYCDIIASCRYFVTVHSGAHCMAAALRSQRDDPGIMCMASREFYNARLAVFPKVEYFVV